ncbi:hypothetical protein SAMN05443667_11928 [Flavobacterium gillisiae]|uniref:Uncharacterized protein n=1 Tax=Flavobacterium gillisiae TaxID=150146 RepID=A0A1H4GAH5_9FLAO|nr:hypothetical protein [Flavobacterium gillisiae]SEB06636.1 hypothetical protein SAMN05443667_11928 [Flavobacterium gillisiae]
MDIQFWIDHADSLFHQIFMIVMGGLVGMAALFGTTYNVINILVYYILIPASWIYLISRKTSIWINVLSLISLLFFLLLPGLRANSDYAFQKSVDFLNWTAKIFNSNYIDMSVYICVVAVGLIYLLLIPLTLPKKLTKKIGLFSAIISVLYLIIIYPNFKEMLLWGLNKMNVKY